MIDGNGETRLFVQISPDVLAAGGGTLTGTLVASPTNKDPGIQLKPVAGASADSDDVLEWYDDAGNFLGYIDANGGIESSAKSGSTAHFLFVDPLGATLRVSGGGITNEPASGRSWQVTDSSSNGRVQTNDTGLGFFGTAPAAKPTVTGAKLPSDVALASLLTALVALGLITNSTT